MQWRRQARYYPDPVRGDVTQSGCQGGVFKEVMFELGSERRRKGNRKRDGKNPGAGSSSMYEGCVAKPNMVHRGGLRGHCGWSVESRGQRDLRRGDEAGVSAEGDRVVVNMAYPVYFLVVMAKIRPGMWSVSPSETGKVIGGCARTRL